MKIERVQLIDRLKTETLSSIQVAEMLKTSSKGELNFKSNPETWSILECIEHLNLYGDFYLPEIEKSLKKASNSAKKNFKSGILGNYFSKVMLPKTKLNAMKTFADKNPNGSHLDVSVLDRFIQQQNQLLKYLHEAEGKDLAKARTPISINKWIKLRLGDTFSFYSNHIIRHLKQIERIQRHF